MLSFQSARDLPADGACSTVWNIKASVGPTLHTHNPQCVTWDCFCVAQVAMCDDVALIQSDFPSHLVKSTYPNPHFLYLLSASPCYSNIDFWSNRGNTLFFTRQLSKAAKQLLRRRRCSLLANSKWSCGKPSDILSGGSSGRGGICCQMHQEGRAVINSLSCLHSFFASRVLALPGTIPTLCHQNYISVISNRRRIFLKLRLQLTRVFIRDRS